MDHNSNCKDGHTLTFVEGTTRRSERPAYFYADPAPSTSADYAVYLGVQTGGVQALLLLSPDEALALAEQLICCVRQSAIALAVAETTK